MTDVPVASATGEEAQPDHVGIALRGILVGAVAGLGLVSLVMWGVRTLQVAGGAPLAPKPSDTIATVILAGWMGSAIAGGFVSWTLLKPIRSAYRRGGLAMVGGFAGLLFTFVTAPVDGVLGRWGLLGLAGVAGLWFVLLARKIARRARELEAEARVASAGAPARLADAPPPS